MLTDSRQEVALTAPAIAIDTHAARGEDRALLLAGIREGLLRTPREIAPRFFYDDAGSALFEAITALPEYYQTRTESAVLATAADDISRRTRCRVLVELGSGSATKTRMLLDAMFRSGDCDTYVPFDVNESVVRRAAESLVQRYPGLRVHGVIGDFLELDSRLPSLGRRLVIFLGGTIGNLTPAEAARFLQHLASALEPDEAFLLGVDFIKAPERLNAAYNDAQGTTAAFNRNILRVLNRITGSDFVPERFAHLAFYDPLQHWIEMRLVAQVDHSVRLPAVGLTIDFRAGEFIRTEISVKYDQEMIAALLGKSGFAIEQWYTDRERLFGLALARRVGSGLSSAP